MLILLVLSWRGFNKVSFEAFFKKYPLFHYQELIGYLNSSGGYNLNTLKASLQYHVAKKHLLRIRRGYYVVTKDYLPGIQVENDHVLIAGHMAEDAVISYHTAMEFHSHAYFTSSKIYYNSKERIGKLIYGDVEYNQLSHPKALKNEDIFFETKQHDRLGMDIRVTSIERTLVDALNRPELSGGWEEIWRSFESINFLDIQRIVSYALKLGNATTIAKLGFFLEQHREQFKVKNEFLDYLSKYKPKSRHYMERFYHGQVKNLERWNLIVPLAVINKTWEELYDDIV